MLGLEAETVKEVLKTHNHIQPNSIVTNNSGVRYNRVNLCSKMTNLPLKSARYNRVFVYNQVLLYQNNFCVDWSFYIEIRGRP